MTKICVIGGGVMGQNHARILKELNALHSIVEVNANLHGALHKFSCPIETTIPMSADGYIIATPTTTHYSIADKLLATGKPTLIEKPVCATLKQALELQQKYPNAIVAVGHTERFNPAVQYAKEWLQQRQLKIINSYRLSAAPLRIVDVGVILDLAIHDIDAQIFLTNARPIAVTARAIYPTNSSQECYGRLIIEYENGVLGNVEVSWLNPTRVRQMTLVASDVQATIDYLTQSFSEESSVPLVLNSNGFNLQLSSSKQEVQLARREPLKSEIENFLSAIEGTAKPYISLQEGTLALAVIEGAYKSIQTNQRIIL